MVDKLGFYKIEYPGHFLEMPREDIDVIQDSVKRSSALGIRSAHYKLSLAGHTGAANQDSNSESEINYKIICSMLQQY